MAITPLSTSRRRTRVYDSQAAEINVSLAEISDALDAKVDDSQISAFGLTLVDDANAVAARATLGLGTLATQNGTFSGTHSGTSSGTNTGDETGAGILAKLLAVDGPGSALDADLLDGLSSADFARAKSFCRLAADYTLTSTTAAQKLFDTTSNGALTLPAGRYVYRAVIYLTGMSATSGNAAWNLLGAGTATLVDHIYATSGGDASTLGVGGKSGGGGVLGVSEPASIFTAAVGTAMFGEVAGSFSLSMGGTVIPSVALVTAAAAVAMAGSYIVIEALNADGASFGGAWT